MSTASNLAADIKAETQSTNVRSLVQVFGEPQPAQSFDEEAFPSEQDPNQAQTVETEPANKDLAAFTTWQTRVKVFLLSTGKDSGSRTEIRVRVDVEGYAPAKAHTDLPTHSNWYLENGGLGHLLAHQVRTRVGAVPLSFRAHVDENDSIGSDVILDLGVDFTRPEWIKYANNGPWHMKSKNSKDEKYVAVLWWEVTQV